MKKTDSRKSRKRRSRKSNVSNSNATRRRKQFRQHMVKTTRSEPTKGAGGEVGGGTIQAAIAHTEENNGDKNTEVQN